MEKRLVKTLFVLAIPLLLGTMLVRMHKAEPYPALFLPAGDETIVEEADTITFTQWELAALTEDGLGRPVDPHQLLATVPTQYRIWIIWNNFGLPSDQEETPPSAGVTEARSWLLDRLQSQLGSEPFVAIEVQEYEVQQATTEDGESEKRLVTVTTLPLS